jgi:hypothetical protein
MIICEIDVFSCRQARTFIVSCRATSCSTSSARLLESSVNGFPRGPFAFILGVHAVQGRW